jgi:tRNA pseudouridine38-40 synthase
MKKRMALGLQYEGTAYRGFQAQAGLPTIQAELEAALSCVANEPITVFCAGRTDAGVHAQGQVVHFDTEADRPDYGWLQGTNAKLPNDIAVQWVQEVSEDFHARYKAMARVYRYVIANTRARSALTDRFATWIYRPLNAEAMHRAAQALLGTHDFSAFRAAECQAKNPVKTMEYVNVTRQGDYLIVDIKADAFLHHMVRNIVGTLLPIGMEEEPITYLQDALISKDRTRAGMTAKPCGLSLVEIHYPEHFNLPIHPANKRMIHELV